MRKRDHIGVLLTAMIFGLIGGIVGGRFFVGDPVLAEKTPKPEKVIKAEAFEVVNENGVTLGMLGSTAANGGRLALYNEKKNVSAELAVFGEDSRLKLRNHIARIELEQGEDGGSLEIYGKDALPLIKLNTYANGPSLDLLGANHREKISLSVFPDLGPGIHLIDKGGKHRAILQLTDSGDPALNLLDKEEKFRSVVGITRIIEPNTGASIMRPVSSVVLFDKGGKVLWSAP